MVPVSTVLPDALASALRRAPLTPEKVRFAWRHAAGAAIDRVTMVELQGGVLVVRTRDAAWQREVERAAPLLLSRLARLLGEGCVRRIDACMPDAERR